MGAVPVRVRVHRLCHGEGLELPAYATEGAAGMDLRAAVRDMTTVAPGEVALIPTGLRVEVPEGYEMQVRPRSGLALRSRVTILNAPGTIDSDYRGEIRIILANFGTECFEVHRGDRIAQLVLTPVARCEWEPAESLSRSMRGPAGFGHTGRE